MVNKNDISDIWKFLIAFVAAMTALFALIVAGYDWEGKKVLDYLDAKISEYINFQWLTK